MSGDPLEHSSLLPFGQGFGQGFFMPTDVGPSPVPSPSANLAALHSEAEESVSVLTSMASTEPPTPAHMGQASHDVSDPSHFLSELSEMPSDQLYPSALHLDDAAMELSDPPIAIAPVHEEAAHDLGSIEDAEATALADALFR